MFRVTARSTLRTKICPQGTGPAGRIEFGYFASVYRKSEDALAVLLLLFGFVMLRPIAMDENGQICVVAVVEVDANLSGAVGNGGGEQVSVVLFELAGASLPDVEIRTYGEHAGGAGYGGDGDVVAVKGCLTDALADTGIGEDEVPDGAECRSWLTVEVK